MTLKYPLERKKVALSYARCVKRNGRLFTMVRVLESASPDEGLLTMFAVRVQVKCYQKYFMIFTDTSDNATSYVQICMLTLFKEK